MLLLLFAYGSGCKNHSDYHSAPLSSALPPFHIVTTRAQPRELKELYKALDVKSRGRSGAVMLKNHRTVTVMIIQAKAQSNANSWLIQLSRV